MKYLDTAFGQLAAAWKLYHYALEGKIDLETLDVPLTFEDKGMVLVLPDKIFDTPDDLILFFQNNLSVHFGAAVITLDRAREEAGITLPADIVTEDDQFIGVTYQIRNAFAHDISEPRWHITRERYRRPYTFDGTTIDLSNRHGTAFEYEHIGGPDVLFRMKDYAMNRLFDPNRLIKPALPHAPST